MIERISERLRSVANRLLAPTMSIEDCIRAAEDAIRRGDVVDAERAVEAALRRLP